MANCPVYMGIDNLDVIVWRNRNGYTDRDSVGMTMILRHSGTTGLERGDMFLYMIRTEEDVCPW